MKKCFILAVLVTAFIACNDNNDAQRDKDNIKDSLPAIAPDSNMSYPADTTRPDPSFPR